MLKNFAFLALLFVSGLVAPAFADEIELDWNAVELGFFDNLDDAGEIESGLAVYVPGNRIATADDFHALIPEFCSSRLEGILKFAQQIEGARDVSLLKLQIDFYGPKVGKDDTYVGRSATMDLADGRCSL